MGISGTFYLGERGCSKPIRELLTSPDVGSLALSSGPHRLTLAVSETVFQFPPLRVNLPLPIRVRISSGVSLGPLANGVYLEEFPNLALASGLHCGTGGRLGGWQLPEAGPWTQTLHSPCQHGVQQNAQAPYVTAFIVALTFQHLAGGGWDGCGQAQGHLEMIRQIPEG